jgi:predicted SpoU family rRNA methylase
MQLISDLQTARNFIQKVIADQAQLSRLNEALGKVVESYAEVAKIEEVIKQKSADLQDVLKQLDGYKVHLDKLKIEQTDVVAKLNEQKALLNRLTR